MNVNASFAATDDMITWGEIKTGIYDLKFPQVNERSETTGYDLQRQQMTKDASAKDFHFNTGYPSFTWTLWAIDYMHGGKALYDQELSEPTKRVTQIRAEMVAIPLEPLEVGGMALLVTSTDEFAQIRIDRITPSKVEFSYVLETDKPLTVPSKGAPVQTTSSIQLQISSAVALVDGKQVPLDVSPEIINGSTVVPLRFVSENLKQQVSYEVSSKKITITPKNK